jgi:hypothetical protein
MEDCCDPQYAANGRLKIEVYKSGEATTPFDRASLKEVISYFIPGSLADYVCKATWN